MLGVSGYATVKSGAAFLPLKRRRDELKRCRQLIETGLARRGIRYRLAFKQLYHDREEVTGYFRRLD
jgi:23S rRNA (cytidine2498-2'-O)-methyltransferase